MTTKLKPLSLKWRNILRHIHSLSWATLSNITPVHISNYKYARQILTRLTNDKYLFKVTCPLFPHTKGSGMNFYTLDTKGFKEINGSARGFKRRHVPTSVNLLHTYIANIFHTGLQSQKQFHADTLTEKEILEKESFYKYFLENYDKQNPVSFAIPDFAFLLRTENKTQLFLGEVDTSTENITSAKQFSKTIYHKFESFDYYFNNSIFKYFESRFDSEIHDFIYLHVTTGKKDRITTISQLCQQLDIQVPVLITTASKLYPKINYDENRVATVDYTPLLNAKWLHINEQRMTTIPEVLL